MRMTPKVSCAAAIQLVRGLLVLAAVLLALDAFAGGGPLGIDHRAAPGADTGIWQRRNQLLLQEATIAVVLGTALWEGDSSRLGHTAWQSADSMLLGAVTSTALKVVFSRTRPAQTDDANRWFQGSGNRSFPSGEVMTVTTAVTPFVLEYASEHPAVWALELLPLYDAIARVRSRGHWQTDVLASFAIGTGISIYAHQRKSSLTVGVLPGGLTVGWKTRF